MSKTVFSSLLDLAKHLRSPEGCPWDREQTMQSLSDDLLEEAQETVEAIEENDPEHIREEIGDTLFCLSLLIAIAEEKKLFDYESICKQTLVKIKTHHTWVFGDDKIADPEQALKQWHKNKKKEKRGK